VRPTGTILAVPMPITRRELLIGGAALAGMVLLPACSSNANQALRLRIKELAYGDAPMQRGDLHVPLNGTGHPVVVLVHGGYWAVGFDRSAMRPLAEQLVLRGYAVWNIDYRRVGEEGGGWPGTLTDVGDAMDHLAEVAVEQGLDTTRVAVIGHSAGSQLAFWAASRRLLPVGAPGADPVVQPTALASLSGVLDLEGAANLPALGRMHDLRSATLDLMGGTPTEVPERYASASPMLRLPLRMPQLLLHGTDDEIVPVELTDRYRVQAQAKGDPVDVRLIDDADHFDTADAKSAWWTAVLDWLPTVIGASAQD